MRRKIVIKKFVLKPDYKYSSPIVSKLITRFMWNGEKIKSTKIIYKAADQVEKKINKPFLEVLNEALENLKPGIEMKRKKVGGSYQRIPIKVSEERNLTIAFQLMKNSVRENKVGKPTFEKLAEEISNSYTKTSNAFKKKETLLKEAESSRVLSR